MSERSKQPRYSVAMTGCVVVILMMASTPSFGQEVTRKSETSITDTLGGFFGGVWDGVVDVVTLQPIFGDDEAPVQVRKISAAGQTSYETSSRAVSTDKGSMSRMMSRMAGSIRPESDELDEYGLPKRP